MILIRRGRGRPQGNIKRDHLRVRERRQVALVIRVLAGEQRGAQTALAQRLRVHPSTLSKWLRSPRTQIPAAFARRLLLLARQFDERGTRETRRAAWEYALSVRFRWPKGDALPHLQRFLAAEAAIGQAIEVSTHPDRLAFLLGLRMDLRTRQRSATAQMEKVTETTAHLRAAGIVIPATIPPPSARVTLREAVEFPMTLTVRYGTGTPF